LISLATGFLPVIRPRKAFLGSQRSFNGMLPSYRITTIVGLLFLVLGALLLVLPFFEKFIPSLERLPWFLIYVYRRGDFYFVTSPVLIVLSLLSLLLYIAGRMR